jgi:hypothetical protein
MYIIIFIFTIKINMKHKHVCKGCNQEFYGRRNQEFHDLHCKTDFHNERAAILRAELKDNKISQKNYKIIKEAYSKYKNRSFLVIDLIQKGLELAAPTRKWKTPKNGFEIYLSNGFGYRIFTENGKQFISIYKEEEIDNL